MSSALLPSAVRQLLIEIQSTDGETEQIPFSRDPIPEPAASTMLALALGAMLRRKRN